MDVESVFDLRLISNKFIRAWSLVKEEPGVLFVPEVTRVVAPTEQVPKSAQRATDWTKKCFNCTPNIFATEQEKVMAFTPQSKGVRRDNCQHFVGAKNP